MQHDAAGMEKEAAELIGTPGWEDLMFYYQSDTAAYSGHFTQARELTRRAADSAQRADKKETAAAYEAEAAMREALVGNLDLAKRQAGTLSGCPTARKLRRFGHCAGTGRRFRTNCATRP